MARVARRVGDRRVLKLIRRSLDAGVMVSGVKVATLEGTPQGSPLSPLLANIMLDDLDHELILGCVAGDDTVILVTKSAEAAELVSAYLTRLGG